MNTRIVSANFIWFFQSRKSSTLFGHYLHPNVNYTIINGIDGLNRTQRVDVFFISGIKLQTPAKNETMLQVMQEI